MKLFAEESLNFTLHSVLDNVRKGGCIVMKLRGNDQDRNVFDPPKIVILQDLNAKLTNVHPQA